MSWLLLIFLDMAMLKCLWRYEDAGVQWCKNICRAENSSNLFCFFLIFVEFQMKKI